MEETYSKRLLWKKKKAMAGHARRLASDATEPGRVPIYHFGFYSYLRWTLATLPPAKISPDPEQNIPVSSADGALYQKYIDQYGWFKPLPDVPDFLQGLLGEEFVTVFDFEAGLVDYEYLADILAVLSAPLDPVPLSMAGASKWLNERIKQLNAAAANAQPLPVAVPASPIKWVGDDVEIVQLGYALIAAGKIKGLSNKKTIQALGELFGRKLASPSNALNNFKGNKNKKGTLIDRLKGAFDELLNI